MESMWYSLRPRCAFKSWSIALFVAPSSMLVSRNRGVGLGMLGLRKVKSVSLGDVFA